MTPETALEQARATLDGLIADALPADGGRLCWEYRGQPDPWLYDGTAGVVLVLALGHEVTGERRYLDAAERGARFLLGAPPGARGRWPGLFVGEAGLALPLLRLFRLTEDDWWLDEAADRLAWAAGVPPRWTELLYGVAGVGLALLAMHAVTDDGRWLDLAERQAQFLVETAVAVEDTLRWAWSPLEPDRAGAHQLGLAHGAAGIARFLRALVEAAGPGGPWGDLLAGARRSLERAAIVQGDAADWPASCGGEPEDQPRVQWCHGAPGVGQTFALEPDPEARVWAERAGRATLAAGDVRENPCYCHGLAGNLDLLLTFGWRDEALRFAELLAPHAQPGAAGVLRWASDDPGIVRPGLATGSAGVAYALLRLAAPERVAPPWLVVR